MAKRIAITIAGAVSAMRPAYRTSFCGLSVHATKRPPARTKKSIRQIHQRWGFWAVCGGYARVTRSPRRGLLDNVKVRDQVSHPPRRDSGRSSNRNRHVSRSVNTSRLPVTNLANFLETVSGNFRVADQPERTRKTGTSK
jgi:hypothetical protein